jgi:taurine dioxygenase
MFIPPTAATNSVKRDYKHIEVKPYASALGAEIFGVKLANLTAEELQEIKWAAEDHSVIFFRDQNLTPAEQEHFTLNFGEFGVDPFVDGIEGHPNVLRLLKEADEKTGLVFGQTWHSDWTFQEQPPSFTILNGADIPPYGGDTLFASLYNAYNSLSPTMQKFCESTNLVHSAIKGYGTSMKDVQGLFENMEVKTGDDIAGRMQTHPMVTVHPISGRKVLYVSGVYTMSIEGMFQAESDAIINYLQKEIVEHPMNLCRFRWEKGSVAMWDNRCTQHLPMGDYQGMRREMYRTIVAGDKPKGV